MTPYPSPESGRTQENASERVRRATAELRAVEEVLVENLQRPESARRIEIAPDLVIELKTLLDQVRTLLWTYLRATAGAVQSIEGKLEQYRMNCVLQFLSLLHRAGEAPRDTFCDQIGGIVDRKLELVSKDKKGKSEAA